MNQQKLSQQHTGETAHSLPAAGGNNPQHGEDAESIAISLLHTTKDYVVCIKPVGMDAEHELPKALCRQLGGEIYPIHRLDANVGGVMVYARTKQGAAEFSSLVQNGAMVKEYVAMVHGTPEETGDWQDLLWKDSRKNKVFVVDRERKGVKAARLEYKRLWQGTLPGAEEDIEDICSLVRIRLHTGRSHQIRVQFASRKHPLVGDHKYGARDACKEPMLFSCCITFPYKGTQQRFEALPTWAQHLHF